MIVWIESDKEAKEELRRGEKREWHKRKKRKESDKKELKGRK